jgi:hypothetical protein
VATANTTQTSFVTATIIPTSTKKTIATCTHIQVGDIARDRLAGLALEAAPACGSLTTIV